MKSIDSHSSSKWNLPGTPLSSFDFLKPGMWVSMTPDNSDGYDGWDGEYYEVEAITSAGFTLKYTNTSGVAATADYPFNVYKDSGLWLVWHGGTKTEIRKWLNNACT